MRMRMKCCNNGTTTPLAPYSTSTAAACVVIVEQQSRMQQEGVHKRILSSGLTLFSICHARSTDSSGTGPGPQNQRCHSMHSRGTVQAVLYKLYHTGCSTEGTGVSDRQQDVNHVYTRTRHAYFHPSISAPARMKPSCISGRAGSITCTCWCPPAVLL